MGTERFVGNSRSTSRPAREYRKRVGSLSKTGTSRIPGIEFYRRSAALIILFRGSPKSEWCATRALADASLICLLTSNIEFLSQLCLVAANNLAVHLPVPPTVLPSFVPFPLDPPFARPSRILCSAAIAGEVCARMQRSSIFMLISMRLYYLSRMNGRFYFSLNNVNRLIIRLIRATH